MFDYKIENRKVEIWRFMLGSAYQGKGYGKEALNKAIEFLKQENLFDYIQINYVEENLVAKKLYQKVIFRNGRNGRKRSCYEALNSERIGVKYISVSLPNSSDE